MPLAFVQTGRQVRIVVIVAGHGLQGRLANMGLVPGTEIRVLSNPMQGPFLIEIKGSRIMLGRGKDLTTRH
jgi:ferrous iron transport protein A